MRHERPHRFVLGERLVHDLAGDRLAVRRLDHVHALRLRVETVGGELVLGGGLHADGEAIDAGEGAVREADHLVAGQDHRQHAVQPVEARAGHAVGVDVLGAPQLAQHLLGLEHAAQHVFLHVVGDAASWRNARARGDRCSLALGRRQEFRGYRAAERFSSWEHPLAIYGPRLIKRHNRLTGKTRCGKGPGEWCTAARPSSDDEAESQKEEAPHGGSGASSFKFPAGAVMERERHHRDADFTPAWDKSRDIFTKMVKVNSLNQVGQPQRPFEGTRKSP